MEQPHLQRVVIVKASGPPFETPELHEAAELTLDAADGVADQELADRAFELVSPVPFVYEERRSQTDWGASGSVLQELLIQFGADTAAGLTVAGVIGALRAISRRGTDKAGEPLVKRVPEPWNPEAAWSLFEQFMRCAFKVSDARATEMIETVDGWRVRATAGNFHYEGTISRDGQLKHARRLDL